MKNHYTFTSRIVLLCHKWPVIANVPMPVTFPDILSVDKSASLNSRIFYIYVLYKMAFQMTAYQI